MLFLGLDTSNYTTSAALYDSQTGQITQEKQLLPVKAGALGLRQSDAVFHHTVQLPALVERLLAGANGEICAVGASARPRDAAGSYMPCFLVGEGVGRSLAAALRVPFHDFSHQAGHIAAAVYSAGHLELLEREFIAFHVSGGTTEALLCRPQTARAFDVTLLAASTDLKAGQAVDRTGVLLGFPFPAGKYVDAEAQKSEKQYTFRIKLRDGSCSLSGVENKVREMLARGETRADICRYCIDYIAAALAAMADYQLERLGNLPLLFSGGVMANSIMRRRFEEQFGAYFAEPAFSSDNAAGIAYLTTLREKDRI